MAQKKKIGLFRKFLDFARSDPISRNSYAFLAFFWDFIQSPLNKKQVDADPRVQPLPSRFHFFMVWVMHALLNGALIWFVLRFALGWPLGIWLIFPFGAARFLALDLINEFFWKPAERVSSKLGASRPR